MTDPEIELTAARAPVPAKILLRARVRRLQEDHPSAGVALVLVPPTRGAPKLWVIRTALPYLPGFENLVPSGLLAPFTFPDGRLVFAFGGVMERDLSMLAQVAEDAISMHILDTLAAAIKENGGSPLDLDEDADWMGKTLPGLPSPNPDK